jgi:hypothetical protein
MIAILVQKRRKVAITSAQNDIVVKFEDPKKLTQQPEMSALKMKGLGHDQSHSAETSQYYELISCVKTSEKSYK